MKTENHSTGCRFVDRCIVTLGISTVIALSFVTMPRIAAAQAKIEPLLAAHRAIYDLKLADTHGKQLESVRGRIVYDFSGNRCDGYALQFRQVTELDSGEGKLAVSDLRSTTWEDAAATAYRFNSQNFLNQEPLDSVDGLAQRQGEQTDIKLNKPEDKEFKVGPVVFPSQHIRKIIEMARAGKSLLELTVYDGSETGQKIYNSLTVIGRKIVPNEKAPDDAAAGEPALKGLARWPVTVSYFDQTAKSDDQMPAYSIAFELYENGISRALLLNYGDFSVSGRMTSLEMKSTASCK